MKLIMTVMCMLFSCTCIAAAQTVVIGPDGKISHPPFDPEGCVKVEHIQPNPTLRSPTHVHGNLRDQTTAPFENSPIELRTYVSETQQKLMNKVTTDEQGNFDLGTVPAGKYRLLLSPNRAFAQAESLNCASTDCALNVTLTFNPTDTITAACPIR